jgi:IS1 family transposase
MNTLSRDQQTAVVRALVEGNSLRSVSRMTGVARNTIAALLRDLGAHCKNHHDRAVRGVAAKRVQADEAWAFCGVKQKRATDAQKEKGLGDAWTWAAIDQDTKLMLAYRVGPRDGPMARAFMADLADRLTERCQLTTDGLRWYPRAVEEAFGWNGCDFAQLNKVYALPVDADHRYSPAVCIGAEKQWVMGKPNFDDVCTSHVERQNLTLRMQVRRYTRLTNAFSKKLEYHLYATALHFSFYNWCRPHLTLSKAAGKPTTPAMAAGLADRVWTAGDLLDLLQGD